MSARRSVALALVALPLVALLGGLLLPEECADTCSPDCGDCLTCSMVAVVAGPPPGAVRLASASLALGAGQAVPSVSRRPLDHVPLSRAA